MDATRCSVRRNAITMNRARERAAQAREDNRIARLLDRLRPGRHTRVAEFLGALERVLRSARIHADLSARLKEPASVRHKMLRMGLDVDAINDVCGVRVLVDEVETCYEVLRLVHDRWQHLPAELDDYIRQPKANGYQSLHTTLVLSNGKTLEVQIRTREQHRNAEFGEASHRLYKWASLREFEREG